VGTLLLDSVIQQMRKAKVRNIENFQIVKQNLPERFEKKSSAQNADGYKFYIFQNIFCQVKPTQSHNKYSYARTDI
jgi:hypothetical protein